MIVCRFKLEVQRKMNIQTVDMEMGVGKGEGCAGEDSDKAGQGLSIGPDEGGRGWKGQQEGQCFFTDDLTWEGPKGRSHQQPAER